MVWKPSIALASHSRLVIQTLLSRLHDDVRHLLDTILAIPEDMPQERVICTIYMKYCRRSSRLNHATPDGVTLAVVREYLQASLAEIPANYGRPLLDGSRLPRCAGTSVTVPANLCHRLG